MPFFNTERSLMPEATTTPFIEGQGIPVELRNVEAELAKLWGPAAEQLGGPDLENSHVTRVALANLVVECLDGNLEPLGLRAGNCYGQVPLPGHRALWV